MISWLLIRILFTVSQSILWQPIELYLAEGDWILYATTSAFTNHIKFVWKNAKMSHKTLCGTSRPLLETYFHVAAAVWTRTCLLHYWAYIASISTSKLVWLAYLIICLNYELPKYRSHSTNHKVEQPKCPIITSNNSISATKCFS